ncbi:hypothetical protein V1264_020613 [Littorina saxatilis]
MDEVAESNKSGRADTDCSEKYEERFVEIEFRALRAYLMNYKESSYFDKWSRCAEVGSYLLGLLGLVGGTSLIIMNKRLMGGTLFAISFPTSGAIQWSARGQSRVIPSFATRAQQHVDAGAEWTRIHRLAKLYRSQLKSNDLNSSDVEAKYLGLLDAYKLASLCTVIREKAYKEFNDVKLVCGEHDRRRNQVTEYCAHEKKREEHMSKKIN